jgi:DNA-binding response OmpR family regulator
MVVKPQRVVLIVEDDVALRRLFRTALTLDGFEVEEAGDGLEALRRIADHPPDVVVLDLGLPTISGFAVHQEITAHALTRRIPIVVVTGSTKSLEYLEVACILRKPVTPEELVLAVRNCLAAGAPPVSS